MSSKKPYEPVQPAAITSDDVTVWDGPFSNNYKGHSPAYPAAPAESAGREEAAAEYDAMREDDD
jgi:hypothetical protein